MKAPPITRHPLPLLCLAFTILVLMHSFSTPVFEAPDEVWHYAYVRWVAEGHGLPDMDNDESGANQEVAQPPLYYLVAALFSAPFPDDDLDTLFWGNPGFGYQSPGTTADNKNMLIHTKQERFPWRGAVLAIHITRLSSLLFGLLTILAAWGLGKETFGTQRGALLTATLVAFHPQFVFISSVVSNDSTAAAICTAALWMVARSLRHGITLRRAMFTGLFAGLAMLSKTSAILMLPLAGLALLLSTGLKRASLLPLSRYALTALLTGGWWYGRNVLQYGDPLGISSHTGTLWGRPAPVSLVALLPEFPILLRSFWAAYGWGHVTWGNWVYAITWALSGYFILRTTARVIRRWPKSWKAANASPPHLHILGVTTLWFGGIFAALLQWMRQVQAPHGRLLFPALGAWALLLAYGVEASPTRTRKYGGPVSRLFLTWLFLLAALAPGARILATFAPPRLCDPPAVAQGLSPIHLSYAEQAELIGVKFGTQRAHPGDTFAVKVCWQAVKPMTEDYTVFVHLIGPGNSRVAERHTYPGLGRFPTSLWPVGRAFCDAYRVNITTWADAPLRYGLEVGLFDTASGERLLPQTQAGQPVEPPIVGMLSVVPKDMPSPTPEYPATAQIGAYIQLHGYDRPSTAHPGETVNVMLYWEALQAPGPEELVTFVHLWHPGDAKPLAQHDSLPRQGWYPTSSWQARDVIPDAHPLALPNTLAPGTYPLWAGLYRAEDGIRLAAVGSEGPYDYNLVPLGMLIVE